MFHLPAPFELSAGLALLTDSSSLAGAIVGSADDQSLLRRIADRDRQAMRELCDRYADRLLRFAYPQLHDRQEAEDVVQETMLAVWQGAGTFRQASRPSTWVFGICRNKIGERLRRRRELQPLDGLPDLAAHGTPTATVELWQQFRLLSPEHREVLLLVFHQGFSQEEVAEMLGVPVGTVKSRTFHARRRLQALLEGGEPGERGL